VSQVIVLRPGGLGSGRDGDGVLGSKLQEILATGETVEEGGNPPGGDNLKAGVACLPGKLESDLVVALASAAVAENLAVVLVGNPDLSAGNDGAGQTGSEKVSVLVDGIALDGGEDELIDKLLLEVLNDHALGTESESLLLDLGEVFLLTDVGKESLEAI
jgi:hypothetical protein